MSKTPRQRQIDFVRDKQKRKSRVSIGLKRKTTSYASTFEQFDTILRECEESVADAEKTMLLNDYNISDCVTYTYDLSNIGIPQPPKADKVLEPT